MSPIEVLIADDCALFCESLAALLATENSIHICAAAPDGTSLLQLVERHRPGVVLTDLYMPGITGAEAARVIKKLYPSTAVLGITLMEDEQRDRLWREAGVDGYVVKSTISGRELVAAIHCVHGGRPWFPAPPSPGQFLDVQAAGSALAGTAGAFTEKELEIIRLICEQYSSKQIADRLGLSHRTVEDYRRKIMDKVGAQNRMGIAAYAFKNGLITG